MIAGGVDVGGTFADFILADLSTGSIHSTPSTPHIPAPGVVEGLSGKYEIAAVTPDHIDCTTVGISSTRVHDGRLLPHSVRRFVGN